MAGRGGNGLELDLDQVPLREEGMTPYEILLSESQERMLLVAAEGKEDAVRRICTKWDLDAAVIGRVTDERPLARALARARSWRTCRSIRSPRARPNTSGR